MSFILLSAANIAYTSRPLGVSVNYCRFYFRVFFCLIISSRLVSFWELDSLIGLPFGGVHCPAHSRKRVGQLIARITLQRIDDGSSAKPVVLIKSGLS